MLNKQQLLQEVQQAAAAGLISKKELLEAIENQSTSKRMSLATILSYIGGAIILVGITIYFGQQWSYLSDAVKLLLTLGFGILLYLAGFIFYRDSRTHVASFGIFFIAFSLIPFGLYLLFDMVGFNTDKILTNIILSLLLTTVSVATLMLLRHTFFLLSTVIFSTWLYYAVIAWILDRLYENYYDMEPFYAYMVAIQGLVYLALGYLLQKNQSPYKALAGVLYFFGSASFLTATYYLAFYNYNLFWLWLYPLVILGTILLSVKLTSRSFLTLGSIYLIAYIIGVTGRYFASSLGWPIALIFIGALIIAIALESVRINKKYLSKKSEQANAPTPSIDLKTNA